MRLRLLIDVEADAARIAELGELVTGQPGITVTFTDQRAPTDAPNPSPLYGRLVGAREAHGMT